MEITETSTPFNQEKVVIELLKVLRHKGLLTEDEVLNILWEAKDPFFPWSKTDIKDLFNL